MSAQDAALPAPPIAAPRPRRGGVDGWLSIWRAPRNRGPILYRLLCWSCRHSLARTDATALPAPAGREAIAAADRANQRLGDVFLFLFAALLLFTLVKQGTDYVADAAPALVWLWAAVLGVPAAACAWIDIHALPRFAVRAIRAGSLFLAFYFVIEPFAVPYAAVPPGDPAVIFHQHARWAGLAFALLGLWRPAGLFAAAMTLWMMRELQTALTGFYFSTLDIRNLAEVLAFWAIGFTLVGAVRRQPRLRAALAPLEGTLPRAALVILAAGVGAHLANYFWSGLAKLALDGGPASWLLGNRLYDGIPAALEKGTMPLAAWPAAVTALDTLLRRAAIPINLIAFAVQVSVIVMPARRRWLLRTTLALDAFHLLVWATLGLLFWKWIALNLIIVTTLAAIRDEDWTMLPRATCIAFVIAGMAMFRTATLAWYETPGFASPAFVAVTEDGRRWRIPNAYFLSSSYQVSQARLWWPGGRAHFNPSIWGSVLHWQDALAGRTCTVPQRRVPAPAEWGPPAALARFVQAHHRQMLPRLDAQGRLAYYRVPHHHVPAPFVADPFYAVDKRHIATYIFVMDSVCLSLDQGRLRRRVVAHTELPLYDARADRLLQ